MSNIKELKILSKGFGRFLILIYIYTAKRVFFEYICNSNIIFLLYI